MRTVSHERQINFACAAVIAIPVCFLLRQMFLPIWFDEAYTIGTYASQPMSRIVTDYSTPNNHIAYSLVLHFLCGFRDEPWFLRVPSLLASCALLAVLYRFVVRNVNATAAVAAVLLLGLNQVFLNYATQIRGYSFSMLFGVLIADIAIRRDDRSGILRTVRIVIPGALWVYTIPTNVLFLTGIAAWSTGIRFRCSGPQEGIREMLRWLAAAILAAAFYFPVADQLLAARSASPFTCAQVIRNLSSLLRSSFLDLPILLVFLASIPGLLLLRWKRDELNGNSPVSIIIISLMVTLGSAVSAMLFRIAPYGRNFTPLLPFLAATGGVGIATAGQWLTQKWRIRNTLLSGAVAVIAVQTCYLISFPDRLVTYRQSGKPENPYFLYTAAAFDPGAAVMKIARARRRGDHYICIMTERAWQNLSDRFAWFNVPPVFDDVQGQVESLFLIAMSEPQLKGLAAENNISSEALSTAQRTDLPGFILIEVRLGTPVDVKSLPNPLGITASG